MKLAVTESRRRDYCDSLLKSLELVEHFVGSNLTYISFSSQSEMPTYLADNSFIVPVEGGQY